jgi:hypothetical protein
VLFVNILSTGTVPGKGFMATPINAPMAGEIWHLSIEDLFQPVQEAPRLGGDGPFVINLSVSTAPINLPTKSFTSKHLDAQVYQIQVSEDGRTRYRLRLGPFATEDEADAILTEVRDTYPGALTATASASDLRVIASMQAKAESRHPVKKPTENVVIDKAVSAKIAATPSAPEKAAPQKAAPQKAPPQKASIEKAAVEKAVVPAVAAAKAEAEVSIDVAWPTPALVVPPNPPAHAAAAPEPQWELPELDVPLPTVQKRTAAPAAPVLTAAVTAVPKAAAKVDPPLTLVDAPVLTEVVVPSKAHASKHAAKRAAIAAPILTEAVRPKAKATSAPVVVKTPAPDARVAPTSPPAASSPPASTPAPAAASRPTLPNIPVRTALTALVAQAAAQTAPIAPPPAAATAAQSTAAQSTAAQSPAAPAPKPAAAKSAAPTPPAKPAAPVDPQSIAHAPPRKSAAARLRAFAQKATGNKLTSLQHVVVATAPVPAPREVKKLDEPLESLESTQTLRVLTPTELEDHAATRWFVIQLATADHAFDPDAVPNLDIFSEYRLYSVAGVDEGRVVHTLRLGFFREEIGAVAVASYLAAYWDKPTIKRVSVAERERFASQRVEARKDVGATGKHAVIEITDELVARRRRSSKMPAAAKPAHRPI